MNYFKYILITLVFAMLQACVSSGIVGSSSERPSFHQAALMGNPDEVRRLLPGVANIDAFDSTGFAAIHWAATAVVGNPEETLKVLLHAGANPNLPQEPAKMTPIFFVSNAERVDILVDAGADVNYRAIDKSTPLFHSKSLDVAKALLARGADKNAVNITGKTAKEHFESILPFIEKNAALASVVEDYKAKIAFLGGNQSATVQTNMFSQSTPAVQDLGYRLPNLDNLIAVQPCPMADTSWVYTGELCSDGKAHGKGSAMNQNSPLRFEGLIESGLPVKGVLFENDSESYEGTFENGLAHGSGVCYYEGAPEECRYFKGQRIDTLHKQRVEFERQQNLVKQQARNNTQPVVQRQVIQQPTQSNTLGDAVQDELFEQGAKFLFDQLF